MGHGTAAWADSIACVSEDGEDRSKGAPRYCCNQQVGEGMDGEDGTDHAVPHNTQTQACAVQLESIEHKQGA